MKTKLSLLILTLFLLLSCATTKTAEDEKLKSKLIGTWSGSEEDNQKHGMTKYWIVSYYKNGTFITSFTAIENCEVEHLINKGKWKIKDGMLYQTFDIDGKTDVYSMVLLDDNNIKYKAKEISIDMDNKEYEFTETRQE